MEYRQFGRAGVQVSEMCPAAVRYYDRAQGLDLSPHRERIL
jgi:hypothetical protein